MVVCDGKCLSEGFQRIDVFAVHLHVQMQVRAGHPTGRAGTADDLALPDAVALRDKALAQVAIGRQHAVRAERLESDRR